MLAIARLLRVCECAGHDVAEFGDDPSQCRCRHRCDGAAR